MFNRKIVFIILFLGGHLLAPFTTKADPDSRSIKISNVTSSGNGCSDQSVYANLSPDGEVITLIFSDFVASKNGGSNPQGVEKNCNVNLTFDIPSGWQFGLSNLELEGASDLQLGSIGLFHLNYRAGNNRVTKLGTLKINSPFQGNYTRSEISSPEQIVWGGCQARSHRLSFISRIAVLPFPDSPNDSSGFLSVDALEGGLVTKMGLLWKPCEKKLNQWSTQCKANLEKSKTQNQLITKEIVVRGKGNSPSQSMQKAMQHLDRRCNKPRLSCQIVPNSCVTHEL